MKIELTEGVARFRQEVEDFDSDFEERGPMVPGIQAKEASDRVSCIKAFSNCGRVLTVPICRYFSSKIVSMSYGESMRCTRVVKNCLG